MDIVGLSMAMAQTDVQSKVGIAMLDKTLDTTESLSSGLVSMIEASTMERSVMPGVGGLIDIRV